MSDTSHPSDQKTLSEPQQAEGLAEKLGREAYVVGEGLRQGFTHGLDETLNGGWNSAIWAGGSVALGAGLSFAKFAPGPVGAASKVLGTAMTFAFVKDLTDPARLNGIGSALSSAWQSDNNTASSVRGIRDNLGQFAFDTVAGIALVGTGTLAGRYGQHAWQNLLLGPHVDQQAVIKLARENRDTWRNWYQLDGSLTGASPAVKDALVPHRAVDVFNQLSKGQISVSGVQKLGEVITRIGAIQESAAPQVGALRNQLATLHGAMETILAKNGGRDINVVPEHWRLRVEPALTVDRAKALNVGDRFKLMAESKNVYEVDANTGNKITYHHVDYPVFDRQQIAAQTQIFRSAGKADLLSSSEPVKGLSQAHYLGQVPFQDAGQVSKMTRRGLDVYTKTLELPSGELNNQNTRILDIGAGAQQELARDATAAGLRSKIYSLDPGLAMKESGDLARLNYTLDKAYRLEGRRSPQPLTAAAHGESLPIASDSIDRAYAMFSLPYWAKDARQVDQFLSEVNRVVRPGGIGRIYPVRQFQTPIVERWLAENGLAERAELKFKPPQSKSARARFEESDYWLLTINF